MLFSDLSLSRRLEAAEGSACRQFALARRRLSPESGSEAIRVAGADVVFDGPASPVTQTFGLGMFASPTSADLDEIGLFSFAEPEVNAQVILRNVASPAPNLVDLLMRLLFVRRTAHAL